MSPRRTRAATAESAVSTRSKAQKINNVSQDVAELAQKVRQSQRKEKSASVRKNASEASTKQSNRKKSPEVTLKGSPKKRTTRRRLNLKADALVAQDEQNVKLGESIKILRDRHCDNIATVELVKTNLLHLNVSKGLEKMPNELEQKAKMSPGRVTPKSTPPKLSLTPHRSKKTPKKSPISLGSPKTHSLAISKLFKSPRKLSLAAEGESSESLENSSSNSHSKISRKRKKGSLGSSPMPDKSASTSPTVKNKRKKSDINLKKFVRKFSKSPKIVLKSPKSKKSKVRKLKLSPSRVRKSTPSTSPASPGATSSLKSPNTSRISAKESPLAKEKFLSPIKRRLLSPKLKKTLTASQIKDVLAEPVVLLEKLSPESMKRKYMVARKIQLSTSVKEKSPSSGTRSNSKLLVSMEKTSTGASPKRNSSTNLRKSSMEKRTGSTDRASPRIKHNTPIQGKNRSPLKSSTPRQEKTALRDTSLTISNTSIDSVNNASFNARLTRHRNQSNTQLSSSMDKSTGIENVSAPFLFDNEIIDTSQSRLSNVVKRDTTYDKDNTMEKQQKDNTYELEQPQTPSLRQMVKKRTSVNANLSSRDNTVKKAKVRFADVTTGADSAQKSVNKLNGSRSSILHNVGAQYRNNAMNSAQKSQTKKVQSPKFNRNSLISPFKRSSPRAHGGTPSTQLSKINQVTPKTFASVEKKSVTEKKSSMKKKMPNFGRIHEEMFAKSESLVDAKKRLETRHLAFAANRILKEGKADQKKLLPSDTRDGIHNRFGFKLKKPEATHVMLKKQTVFSREKQQAETRMVLQGVRTNRRFELQMKARNLLI